MIILGGKQNNVNNVMNKKKKPNSLAEEIVDSERIIDKLSPMFKKLKYAVCFNLSIYYDYILIFMHFFQS